MIKNRQSYFRNSNRGLNQLLRLYERNHKHKKPRAERPRIHTSHAVSSEVCELERTGSGDQLRVRSCDGTASACCDCADGEGGKWHDNADDDGERSRRSNSIGRTTSALVIAVEENQCALDVSPDALRAEGIVLVRSYAEALGVLAAHKAGVNPACLTPTVASIRELEVVVAEEASSHSSAPPLPIREILAPPKTQRSPAVIAMAGDGTDGRTGGGGSILQKLAATDESDGLIEKVDAFEQEQGDDAAPGATYDDIRATIAASRARSYEQGRKGCCGKAADYLGSKGPPPGSPWARGA